MKANYSINFSANLDLKIKEQLSINLDSYENARMILNPSDGTLNTGKLTILVPKPNENKARSETVKILQEVFYILIP